jgi:hypothetical protein
MQAKAHNIHIKVIETKRKPPLWAVKVGARYKAAFMGDDAKDRAIQFARDKSPDFEIVEKPTPKREQARLDAIAGLSKPS